MRLVLIIILAGTVTSIFPQERFRDAILLTHSSGSRLYDYDAYMGTDSGATTVPIQSYLYNVTHNIIGEDTCRMSRLWFPVVYGTDWINWLYCFRNTIGDGSDIYQQINNYEIIILKGGIQTCNMTGWGDYADTLGAGVTNKTTLNYKWIWREMVKVMNNYPDKFFVIMTGSASGDENNTPTGAALAHAFAVWTTDTLAAGLDPIIGNFPPNVYVFDYFHYLSDNEYYLKDHYESGYQGQYQDDHPNATACNDIAPIFVQEVFDAAIDYETVTRIKTENGLIKGYALEQNYPNPFNPTTEINFTLAESENITLKVYDSLGSEVVTLVNEFKESGKHSVNFEAKKLNSGVYFYRIEAGNFTATRKMLLIK